MLNAELNDEWCYVVMLNLILNLAIEHFHIVFSIGTVILFSIHFSIHHSEFRIAEDHR